ncbi:ATP-binding protein [Pseudaquabacterium rugosum]|uniref:ATP-binding protein n=1 Tax=Pseudaquabacterium rugosum TaxID=2984194 RepID=A0ABU9B6K2_9BURK
MPLERPHPQDLRLRVRRESDVPHAVAAARTFALQQGAGTVLAATLATVASELANNLWMHATVGGELLLRLCEQPRRQLELWSLDQGPGIADIALALQEGYSTAGGLGCGLPGAQRLTDEFEILSTPGAGTRIRVALNLPRPPAEPPLRGSRHG